MKPSLRLLRQVEEAAGRTCSAAGKALVDAERCVEASERRLSDLRACRGRASAARAARLREGASAAELGMIAASESAEDDVLRQAAAEVSRARSALEHARAKWTEARREQERSERVHARARTARKKEALSREQREHDDRRGPAGGSAR